MQIVMEKPPKVEVKSANTTYYSLKKSLVSNDAITSHLKYMPDISLMQVQVLQVQVTTLYKKSMYCCK